MAKPRLLFVYGTLMSSATDAMGRAPRARLNAASRVIGPATVCGHLMDLGAYPGLVLQLPSSAMAGSGRVSGELLELAVPDEVFAWLDRYEGIDPSAPANGEYARMILDAELPGHALPPKGCDAVSDAAGAPATIPSWVYVYRGALADARLIPDGAWRA